MEAIDILFAVGTLAVIGLGIMLSKLLREVDRLLFDKED